MSMKIDSSGAAHLKVHVDARSSEAGFEDLIHALRHPHLVFGEAAGPDLVATCALADWEASSAALKRVLEHGGQSAGDALMALRLAGEFTRQHRIQLEGSPWLCVFEMDDEPWARYDIHTSLSNRAATIWDNRFDDILRKSKLERESFYLRFTDGGPL
ncbi:hypothetical protein [Roseateles noduli]|uniref:hypothetical protein n=1 Tax=Roseateles noduli TaxID=2052484 RepID=UPI003D662A2A